MDGQIPSLSQALISSHPISSSYDSSSVPSTLSPQTPNSNTVGPGYFGPGPLSRPEGGTHSGYPPPLQAMPNPDMGGRGYAPEYHVGGGYPPQPDHFQSTRQMGALPVPQTQAAQAAMQAQKRAYRQRRKDPSCDACRERKVKCDATDTSSCSECSSRNVKCQFTKETNRRMSSIKQVQDLEKQLQIIRQQNEELLRSAGGDTKPEVSHKRPPMPLALDTEFASSKRRKISTRLDFTIVRQNLENYGHGVVKSSTYPSSSGQSPIESQALPELPPKHVADHLLLEFQRVFQPTFPIVHWPTFVLKYDAVYQNRSLKVAPMIWAAVFFAILACGSLRGNIGEGRVFLEASRKSLDFWTDEPTIDHIRTAMLHGLFLVETNAMSVAWNILGYAARVAQDLGLHRKAGHKSPVELDIRRRLWWSLFLEERLLALELGRPSMLDAEDCDWNPPLFDDVELALSLTASLPVQNNQQIFVMMVRAVSCVNQLPKALKPSLMTTRTAYMTEEQIIEDMNSFPQQYQIHGNDYLDPTLMFPMIHLQNARLVLHRTKLSPDYDLDTRRTAVDACLSVARDTARLLSRSMRDTTSSHHQSPPVRWEDTLRLAANAYLCTHIWRCSLILCFRADYDAALVCAHASAAIRQSRPINVACGRYLEFFLQSLTAKLQRDERAQLEQSEDLMAYLSGDLQNNVEHAWVWETVEESPRSTYAGSGIVSPAKKEEYLREWNGWDGIVTTLQRLLDEQVQEPHRHAPPSTSERPLSAQREVASTLLARQAGPIATTNSHVSPASRDRMSIADLI